MINLTGLVYGGRIKVAIPIAETKSDEIYNIIDTQVSL